LIEGMKQRDASGTGRWPDAPTRDRAGERATGLTGLTGLKWGLRGGVEASMPRFAIEPTDHLIPEGPERNRFDRD
jgi:hypothetical protein